MKLHRKILGGVAALGLVGGLIVLSPGPAGAQSFTTDVSCTGTDPDSQILLGQIGGSVQIPITVQAEIPATLAAGASGTASFSWVLDPGKTLSDLAATVALTTLQASFDVGVAVSGGSGGPLVFGPTPAQVGVNPPNYPTLTASGQVTAGSSGEITYALTASTINIIAQAAAGELPINMACQVANPSLGATTITAGGSSSTTSASGGTAPTTSTAPNTSPGNSQPRVTG